MIVSLTGGKGVMAPSRPLPSAVLDGERARRGEGESSVAEGGGDGDRVAVPDAETVRDWDIAVLLFVVRSSDSSATE